MKSNELWIAGGKALTMDSRKSIIENCTIHIRDGRIVSLVANGPVPAGGKVLSAKNCLVLPGLINGHTHVGMSLLRGIADDLPLDRWLREYVFPLEVKWGTKDFVRIGTLLASLEMIRGGTTTINDMYYHEEESGRALHEAGLRGLCGQAFVEIGDVQKIEQLFETFDQFVEHLKPYPLCLPVIAPHSIYGVKSENWEKVLSFSEARKVPIHIHLSETQEENEQVLQQYKKTPTEFFEDIGLWSRPSIAAHGTCLTDGDIEILGRRGVGVIHNPESNLKLGTKICRVHELRKAKVAVGLGTDGVMSNNDHDLFQEVDIAAKLQVFQSGAGALKAADAVGLLTLEGAKALGLDKEVGSLEPGKSADLIAVSLEGPHCQPLYDPYSHIVYAAAASDVRHTVVAGRVLMEDRKILTLDEAAILSEVREWGEKIARDSNKF